MKKKKRPGTHRWNWNGGSNPTNLEKRAKEALDIANAPGKLKIYTKQEIVELEISMGIRKVQNIQDSTDSES